MSKQQTIDINSLVIQSVRSSIAKHIAPMEIKGDPWKHKESWQSLVAVTPSGPLLLMEFTLRI